MNNIENTYIDYNELVAIEYNIKRMTGKSA